MCIKTDPRGSKSTRPSRTSPPKQKQEPKPSKQIQRNHQETTVTIEPTNVVVQIKRRKTLVSSQHHEARHLNQTTKAQKSVSFHDVDKVYGIIHCSEYTDQEIADCWFGRADKQRAGAEIRSSIKLFKEDRENFEKCCTLRGLERYSTSGHILERRRKKSVADVLKEQESQRERARAHNCELRIYNETKIRKAYRKHSRAAHQTAHAIGIIDEMEAASQKAILIIPNNRSTRNVLINTPAIIECLRV
jgi:hypothetical protein